MEITAGTALLLIAVVLGIIILAVLFTFVPVMLWISALAAGVKSKYFYINWDEIKKGYSKSESLIR